MFLRNANRSGYKETKAGWIPSHWDCKQLGTLATVQTGAAKATNSKLTNPCSYPYLRVANVQNGRLDLAEIKSMAIEQDSFKRFALRVDDVLFTEGGDFDKLGRGTVWRGELENCIHQNHIFAVRVTSDKLIPRYLALTAEGPVGRRYFLKCAKQTTNLASINATQLKHFPIPLPSPAEQRTIVAVISTWDGAIEQVEKLLDAKQRLKKGLMQQLLTGHLRFPKFDKPAVEKDGFPQGWKKVRIGQLLKVVERPVVFDDNQRYPLLSIRRRSGGLFHRETLQGAEIATKDLGIARAGDFLISKMQVVHGAMGLVKTEHDRMFISGSYIALVPRNSQELDIRFFDWMSRMPKMYRLAYISSYGVHIEKMTFNLHLFFKNEVAVPASQEEQERIVDTLEACQKEVDLLEQYLATLQQQKKGLMQKLLTGEIRVPLAEEVVK